MNRGKIKIIEFGMDDERPKGSPPGSAGAARMKIVEFDNEPAGGGGTGGGPAGARADQNRRVRR